MRFFGVSLEILVQISWRRIEASWTDRVRNEEVLHRVKEESNILHNKKEKGNWLINHIIEGKIGRNRNNGKTRKKK
jgi:hypothetical protein